MSYFIAAFGQQTSSRIKEFEKIFIDIVPPKIRQDRVSIEGTHSCFVNFGGKKTINDLIVRNHEGKTNSWVAIIGTPLIKLEDEITKLDKERFIDNLFRIPKKIIRNDLDGCFALLAFDSKLNSFYASTDLNNTIPIYYAKVKDGVYFSSHELPLARFLQSELDPLGFALAIQLKLTWGEYARFKNIKKLLPAHLMMLQGMNNVKINRYWDPSEEEQWKLNFDDAVNRFITILKDSVLAYYKQSKKKEVICDFTAGEDSRLVLSVCYALGIPFTGMIDGSESDTEVLTAKKAAERAGFKLIVRPTYTVTEEQLLEKAVDISLMYEAYEDFFPLFSIYATHQATPDLNYEYIKFCGAPGGEVFRGAYYLRGKAFFPSKKRDFDYLFFTKMKYMLDFYPGIMNYPDEECKKVIFKLIESSLKEVEDFPTGIKIDHLLRVFQTCNTGMIYKNPRYLPLATKSMTRSIYSLPPQFKSASKITRACTEILYPRLAFAKTQKGVPTIRKTLLRTPLFFPEYYFLGKSIINGVLGRLLKWAESNKSAVSCTESALLIKTLFSTQPYAGWFSSSKKMVTGFLYNSKILDRMLYEASKGIITKTITLGRIIGHELVSRWVYKKI